MRPLKSTQDAANRAAPAAAGAYSLVGSVVVLGAIGYGLDKWLGWSPWGVLGGLLLGVAVGFYELVMMTRQSSSSPGPNDGDDGTKGRT